MIYLRTSIKSTKANTRAIYSYLSDFSLRLSNTKQTGRSNNVRVKTVASIENRSKELLKNVLRSKSNNVTVEALQHMISYLKSHPHAREQIFKDDGVSHLLKLRQETKCRILKSQIQLALSLLGCVDPVKKKGICILALDGGGTRGVMTIEMLKEIQKATKKPIHELFDLIVGTSTGAILAFLIGVQKKSLDDCRTLYSKLSSDIFSASSFVGTGKLFLNHAYYDCSKLEEIFRSELGEETTLIDTTCSNGPKVAAVSTLVSEPVLQAFVFRNYCFQSGHKNMYMGTSKHKLWEAVRASTAAPGFFQEFVLDGNVHQDGGILTNNPTALAIHEAKTLWPDTPIQGIVSIGTGTYHGRSSPRPTSATTLREKLMKIVASATDVEAVHIVLQDLISQSKYIRLNPNMSNDVPLDESRDYVLLQLEQDTKNYIAKFSHKYRATAKMLRITKPWTTQCIESYHNHYPLTSWPFDKMKFR